MRRLLMLALVAAGLSASFLFAPVRANAEAFNYCDTVTLDYHHWCQTIGLAPRNWNKAWRPIGYDISLFYDPGPCCAIVNWWDNPFLDTRVASYAYSGCQNVDYLGRSFYPVTCRTTR